MREVIGEQKENHGGSLCRPGVPDDSMIQSAHPKRASYRETTTIIVRRFRNGGREQRGASVNIVIFSHATII